MAKCVPMKLVLLMHPYVCFPSANGTMSLTRGGSYDALTAALRAVAGDDWNDPDDSSDEESDDSGLAFAFRDLAGLTDDGDSVIEHDGDVDIDELAEGSADELAKALNVAGGEDTPRKVRKSVSLSDCSPDSILTVLSSESGSSTSDSNSDSEDSEPSASLII